ncbi:hypothetical protein RQP46_006156 [Phenoliferia psychrophenolica]
MLESLLIRLALVATAAATALPLAAPSFASPSGGIDAQVNQSTALPTVLGNDAKVLLGGQLAYIVAQTTCVPGDVKSRDCGDTVLTQGGDADAVPYWGVGVSTELDAVVVSFSGTNFSSVLSIATNAQLQLVALDPSLAPLANYSSGDVLVHSGYQIVSLKALAEVIPGVASALKLYPNITRVLVSGHSQGAAMSVFASLGLFHSVPSGVHVQLLSYALPRPGNAAFAELVSNVLPDSQTVIFRNDPIPHTAPGPVYRHSIGERWVESLTGDGVNNVENSRTLSCDGEENVHCADSVPASSYDAGDHIGPYFGVQFGQEPCRDYNTTSTQYGI